MSELVEVSFMRQALIEAERAFAEGEVPVGAVVVCKGEIIARGRNQVETTGDPSAHAEIQALRAASEALGAWRLSEADLYVTLEPCPMCAGAMIVSRLRRLFFGAVDPKAGATVSLFRLLDDRRLNHQVQIHRGLLEEKCENILKRFFSTKR